MIGELYVLPPIITHNGDGSVTQKATHLLVLDILPGRKYAGCDTIARCLALETGMPFDLYTDILATAAVRLS